MKIFTAARERALAVPRSALFRGADTGTAIAPDFLPHGFDRFRQGQSADSKRQGGLGLGLAIVRQLAQLHGGEASAASPGEGRGATFTLRLPLTQDGAQSAG